MKYMRPQINLSNYALMLENRAYQSDNIEPINEANHPAYPLKADPDQQSEAGLANIKSGEKGGAYVNQWNQLVDDILAPQPAGDEKTRDYMIMIFHDDNKTPMTYLQYSVKDGKYVKGSVKLNPNWRQSSYYYEQAATDDTKLSSEVIEKLVAKAKYASNLTNADENALADVISAIVYHTSSNSLSYEIRQKIFDLVFPGSVKTSTYSAFVDNGTMVGYVYSGQDLCKALLTGSSNLPSEGDEATATIKSIISQNPKFGYVSVADDQKIGQLAQAIFDHLDDTYVSGDEEVICGYAIMALDRPSLQKLITKWDKVHKTNAGGKGLVQFAVDEIDSDDTGILLTKYTEGMLGIPNATAKALLTP